MLRYDDISKSSRVGECFAPFVLVVGGCILCMIEHVLFDASKTSHGDYRNDSTPWLLHEDIIEKLLMIAIFVSIISTTHEKNVFTPLLDIKKKYPLFSLCPCPFA